MSSASGSRSLEKPDSSEARPAGDPRVFFAAERTLLAWVRTGLTVIGLGFVVARFGLFLRMVAHGLGTPEAAATTANLASTILGVAFVLLGSAGIAVGMLQFRSFVRQLTEPERPTSYWIGWSTWFAGLIAAIGVVLAVYLVLRGHPM